MAGLPRSATPLPRRLYVALSCVNVIMLWEGRARREVFLVSPRRSACRGAAA